MLEGYERSDLEKSVLGTPNFFIGAIGPDKHLKIPESANGGAIFRWIDG